MGTIHGVILQTLVCGLTLLLTGTAACAQAQSAVREPQQARHRYGIGDATGGSPIDRLRSDTPPSIPAIPPLAQAEPRPVAFHIPPQDLGPALRAFADAAGLRLVFPPDMVAGLRTPGVSGTYTPEQALQRLLAGSGLTYRFTDERTATLERGIAGPLQVEPITVEEAQTAQSAYGPVIGYRATRSATATKTDTPLIETPQSISVITRDRLEAQGARTLAEALHYTAGAQGEPFGFDPRFTTLRIRGFDASDTGLYRDSLQLRNPDFAVSFNLEPYGVERIEVIKGPASILYGAGSPGGLVDLVSKRPLREPFRVVEFDAGSFDRLQGKFDLTGPIDKAGVFSYRLTGLARDSDTQVDFVEDNRLFIAPAFTWRPGDNTTLTFLSHYQRDETRASQALPAEALGTDASGKPFKPETGRQYEIGVKYQPPGWNGLVTLAFFDLTRRNVLELDPATFLQEQTGEIRSRGVELEGVASLGFGLDLIASYTYLDAEITESIVPGEEGARPTQTPEHMASLWADYTIQSGVLNGLGVGAGVRYLGSTFGDTPNTLKVPSVTLADAAVHYDWKKLRLAVRAQNVFDKEYVASCFVRGGPFCSFGERRTVTGSISYRWENRRPPH